MPKLTVTVTLEVDLEDDSPGASYFRGALMGNDEFLVATDSLQSALMVEAGLDVPSDVSCHLEVEDA